MAFGVYVADGTLPPETLARVGDRLSPPGFSLAH